MRKIWGMKMYEYKDLVDYAGAESKRTEGLGKIVSRIKEDDLESLANYIVDTSSGEFENNYFLYSLLIYIIPIDIMDEYLTNEATLKGLKEVLENVVSSQKEIEAVSTSISRREQRRDEIFKKAEREIDKKELAYAVAFSYEKNNRKVFQGIFACIPSKLEEILKKQIAYELVDTKAVVNVDPSSSNSFIPDIYYETKEDGEYAYFATSSENRAHVGDVI